MRILYLTNFYPPLRAGGYPQLAKEVASVLEARGHQVGVLTSNYDSQQAPPDEENVYRLLHLEGDLNYYRPFDFLLSWSRKQAENKQYFEQVVEKFAPDVIVVWSLWALSMVLAVQAEDLMREKVAYYLAGHWPIEVSMHRKYWETPARHLIFRIPKRVLAWLAAQRLAGLLDKTVEMKHVMCVSAGLKQSLLDSGLPIDHARIVYNGIDLGQFSQAASKASFTRGSLKLLYAGQIVDHKGVHTALSSFKELVHNYGVNTVHLTILGTGHPQYIASLRQFTATHNLQTRVTFRDSVPRSEMPQVLSQHDVLLFPSIYAEPLARIVMEAMAMGLVVIGTTTGGTGELLVEGKTGLTFPPEDVKALSDQLIRLAEDRRLGDHLIEAGRRAIEQRFTLDRMVEQLEAYLVEITENGALA